MLFDFFFRDFCFFFRIASHTCKAFKRVMSNRCLTLGIRDFGLRNTRCYITTLKPRLRTGTCFIEKLVNVSYIGIREIKVKKRMLVSMSQKRTFTRFVCLLYSVFLVVFSCLFLFFLSFFSCQCRYGRLCLTYNL